MKKLFSIALVIAMAISCLAIFPSAAIEGDFILGTEFSADGKTLYLTFDVDMTMSSYDIETGAIDIVVLFDSTQLKPIGSKEDPASTFVSNSEKDLCTWYYVGEDELDCLVELEELDDAATGAKKVSGTYALEVLAAPGETIEIIPDFTCISFGLLTMEATDVSGLTTVVPAAAPEYEAPAAASYQTLAGCEVCGTAAGVRFIAEVDAAADEYGMYITANGTTVTLSSADDTFVAKEVTDTTVTFTAVIFSDMTFEVVVFEKYGNTEVTSTAGTN